MCFRFFIKNNANRDIPFLKLINQSQLANEKIPFIDLNVFRYFDSARQTCKILESNDYKRPNGTQVYIKYSVSSDLRQANNRKNLNPFTQEYYLGRLCCEVYMETNHYPMGHTDCTIWWVPEDFIAG